MYSKYGCAVIWKKDGKYFSGEVAITAKARNGAMFIF